MPRVAVDLRPGATGALAMIAALLLTIGLAIALTCRPDSHCHETAATSMHDLPPLAPNTATRAIAPLRFGWLVPPDHADARPWPHGMVITPPRTNDAINLAPRFDLGRVLDTLLSALLAAPSLTDS